VVKAAVEKHTRAAMLKFKNGDDFSRRGKKGGGSRRKSDEGPRAEREREKEKKLRRKSKLEKTEVEYVLRDQFPLIPPFDIEDHIGLSLIKPRLRVVWAIHKGLLDKQIIRNSTHPDVHMSEKEFNDELSFLISLEKPVRAFAQGGGSWLFDKMGAFWEMVKGVVAKAMTSLGESFSEGVVRGIFDKMFAGVQSIFDVFVACKEFLADRVKYVKTWLAENVTVARVVILVEIILAGVLIVMMATSDGAMQTLFIALSTLFGAGSLLVALVALYRKLTSEREEELPPVEKSFKGHADFVVHDAAQLLELADSDAGHFNRVALVGFDWVGIEDGRVVDLRLIREKVKWQRMAQDALSQAIPGLLEEALLTQVIDSSVQFMDGEKEVEMKEIRSQVSIEEYESAEDVSEPADLSTGLTAPSLIAKAQGVGLASWGPVVEGIVGVAKALGMVVTADAFFASLRDVQLLANVFNSSTRALEKIFGFFKSALTIVCTRFGASVGAWQLWSILGGLPAIVDEVRELQEVIEKSDLATNPKLRDRVVDMDSRLAAELRKCTMDRASHVKVVVEQLQKILAPTVAIVKDLNARDTARVAPVPLLLVGPSQAAKSSFWAPLIAIEAKAIAESVMGEPTQEIFRCAPDPKFPYNSYKGQSIVISDDHFASRNDESMLESLYRLFELTGAQKQPVASAEAEEKGKLFLSHEMVVFTENTPDFSRVSKLWANTDAVKQRLANNYQMVYPVMHDGKLYAGAVPRLRGQSRTQVETITREMKFLKLAWSVSGVFLSGQVKEGDLLDESRLFSHQQLARELALQLNAAKVNFGQARVMLHDSILEVISDRKEEEMWAELGLDKVDEKKVKYGLNPLETRVFEDADLPRIKLFLKETSPAMRKSALVKLVRLQEMKKAKIEPVEPGFWEETKDFLRRISVDVADVARNLAWIALGSVIGALVGLGAVKVYFALATPQSFAPRVRTTKMVPWVAPGSVVSATAQVGEPRSNVFVQRGNAFANISAYRFGEDGVREISRGSGFMVTDRVLMTAGHVLTPLGVDCRLVMKVGGALVAVDYKECVVLSGAAIPVDTTVSQKLQLTTDIAFVRLPITIPGVRDSRGLFLAAQHFERLLGERLQRLSRDGPDDPLQLSTGRAVDVRAVKYDNTAGLLPYAILYEAPGIAGESGAPVQHAGPSSFSGFICGVHGGMSPGGLSVMVPFCRENVVKVLEALKDVEAPSAVRGVDFVGETLLVEGQSVVPLPPSVGDVVKREQVVVTAPMVHDIVESPIAHLLPKEKQSDKKLSRLHSVVEVEGKKIHTFQRVLDSFARPQQLIWISDLEVREFSEKYCAQIEFYPSRFELSTEEALVANELGPGFERGQSAGRFALPTSRTKECIMGEDKKPTKLLESAVTDVEAFLENGGLFRDMVTALAKSEPLESEKVKGPVPRTRAFYPDNAVVQVIEKKWFAPVVASIKRNADKLGSMLGSTPGQRDALAKWLDTVVRLHRRNGIDSQIVGFDKVANDMYLELQCHRVVHDVMLGIAEKLFKWHRRPEEWIAKRLRGMSSLLKSSASKYVAMPTLMESGVVGYAAYACTINASGRWLTSSVNDIWNRFSHWRSHGVGISWSEYMSNTMYYTYSDDGIGVCQSPELEVKLFNLCPYGPRTKQDGAYFMGSEVFTNRERGAVFALREASVSQMLCFISRRMPVKEAMEANIKSALIELAARGEKVWRSWCDEIRSACRSAGLEVCFPSFRECEQIRFE